MAERFSTAFAFICASVVIFAGLQGHWDFAATAIGAMAALLGGIVVGRVAGAIGDWQASSVSANTGADTQPGTRT
ncbi:MAG: hypothetical protein IT462_05280 [Planctomycetes bacterium]|nr:hypothetical protein [Planctomycetota bacterium]